MKKTRARKQAGYTLLEVMLAVSVLMVGATGFTALQGASARSIQQAQEHTIALELLQTWIERVRRDATLWTAPGINNMATTTYLQAGSKVWGSWFTPPNSTEPTSILSTASADGWGWDVDPAVQNERTRYCVKLRYQVAHWSAGSGVRSEDTVRVDVMVWRPRNGTAEASTFFGGGGGTQCGDNPDFTSNKLFKVLATTAVRWQ